MTSSLILPEVTSWSILLTEVTSSLILPVSVGSQVAFAASNSELQRHYSYFLNTGTPSSAFTPAISALMERFKWKRVALLYDFQGKDELFVKV